MEKSGDVKRRVPVFAPCFDNRELSQIEQCLQTGWVAQGPMTAKFEKAVAEHEGVEFGVATSSCTTALHLALIGMGLEPRHDILVPSFTFVATANAVEYIGATPVFVDVRQDTYCVDVTSLESIIKNRYEKNSLGKLVNRLTGKELFGVIPVGLFGILAEMPAINSIAEKYSLTVLEDNACALGAVINGVKSGTNPSCLSFHARKSITTGEGGMILTNDSALADTLRKLRSHGAGLSEITRHQNHGFLMPDYKELGYNYRMSDVQAAMGIAQMDKFSDIIQKKRKLAARYDAALPNTAPFLKIPFTPKEYFHTYQSYVVMVDYKNVDEGNKLRNKLMAHLEEKGISTRQGTHAVHLLGYYKKKYGYKQGDLPEAYACDKLSIALPLYANLTAEDQDYVIETIYEARRIF